jgi:hypothetical protein
MKLRCLFGHDWLYGRPAPSQAKWILKWKVLHNRVCKRCGKEDRKADEAEHELERLAELQHSIGGMVLKDLETLEDE